MSMTRKEAIAKLQQVGAKIAAQMGYTEMLIGEDRTKGIWGENFTAFLEEQYGECTAEIKWFKEDKPDNLTYGDNIEFRFRFSSPVLSIDHRKVDGSFASIELSDWNHKAYAEYEKEREALGENPSRTEKNSLREKHEPLFHCGNFKIKEIQVFEGEDNRGLEFLQVLMDTWNNL